MYIDDIRDIIETEECCIMGTSSVLFNKHY